MISEKEFNELKEEAWKLKTENQFLEYKNTLLRIFVFGILALNILNVLWRFI